MTGLDPDNCKLCRFVLETGGDWSHLAPADVQPVAVAEDEHWVVALNENQASLGRVYLVLKRHEVDVASLTSAEQSSLWQWTSAVKRALDALFEPDHYNYMFLMNLTAHAHFHIYPRYKESRTFGDAEFVDSQWGGHYDPAENRRLDDSLQSTLAEALTLELRA